MNPSRHLRRAGSQSGFTMVEMMIASVAFSIVLGAISMGFLAFNRSFSLSKGYAAARLTLSDYINLDLRRSTAFEPTFVPNQTHGGWKTQDWTLPVAMVVPDYYQSNKVTVNQPVRYTMTAAEWDNKKAEFLARGKMPPPSWSVKYGASATTRIVTYQQVGNIVQRREGYGTIARDLATQALSWTWSGTAPRAVEMATGVIEIRGIYSITEDLTPNDLTELAPADVVSQFRANYVIRYRNPSLQSKVATQPGTTISNNLLIRTQFYGL